MARNQQIPERYRRGLVVTGTIRFVAPFGIFVELEPDVDALCVLPNLKRLDREVTPPEVYSVGELIQVRLYVVDRETGQIGGSEIGVEMSDEEFEARYHWTMQ